MPSWLFVPADRPDRFVKAMAQARRRLIITELAAASRTAAAHWPAAAGRLVDMTAAAADVVGRRADQLSPQEQCAVATALAVTARQCAEAATRFGPYHRVPGLRRVHRLATLTSQLEQTDPPTVGARAWLDTPIAAPRHATDLTRAPDVTDAVAALLIALAQGQWRDTLTVSRCMRRVPLPNTARSTPPP